MADVIEPASSGRAKCRGCGARIDKGDLRFGERVPNPFGEGEATYWFHLMCAACRRPEQIEPMLAEAPTEVPDRERLLGLARAGIDHHRLPRIARAQRDPSGRARCRQCRELIEKSTWRIALEIWEDGRFGAMGFIHVACSRAYFGADVLDRVVYFTPELGDDDRAEIGALLEASAAADDPEVAGD